MSGRFARDDEVARWERDGWAPASPLDDTAVRYPKLDLGPWRSALGRAPSRAS